MSGAAVACTWMWGKGLADGASAHTLVYVERLLDVTFSASVPRARLPTLKLHTHGQTDRQTGTKRRVLPALSWPCASLDRWEQPLIMDVRLMERWHRVYVQPAECFHWCCLSAHTHSLTVCVCVCVCWGGGGPLGQEEAFSRTGWSEVAVYLYLVPSHTPPTTVTAGRCPQQCWYTYGYTYKAPMQHTVMQLNHRGFGSIDIAQNGLHSVLKSETLKKFCRHLLYVASEIILKNTKT